MADQEREEGKRKQERNERTIVILPQHNNKINLLVKISM